MSGNDSADYAEATPRASNVTIPDGAEWSCAQCGARGEEANQSLVEHYEAEHGGFPPEDVSMERPRVDLWSQAGLFEKAVFVFFCLGAIFTAVLVVAILAAMFMGAP